MAIKKNAAAQCPGAGVQDEFNTHKTLKICRKASSQDPVRRGVEQVVGERGDEGMRAMEVK